MATKTIRERIGYTVLDLDGNDRQGALAEVNRVFDEAEAKGYTEVRLDWSQRDYEDGYDYAPRGDRPETAEETILRERTEGIQRMAIEQRDRAQLAALKAKYE